MFIFKVPTRTVVKRKSPTRAYAITVSTFSVCDWQDALIACRAVVCSFVLRCFDFNGCVIFDHIFEMLVLVMLKLFVGSNLLVYMRLIVLRRMYAHSASESQIQATVSKAHQAREAVISTILATISLAHHHTTFATCSHDAARVIQRQWKCHKQRKNYQAWTNLVRLCRQMGSIRDRAAKCRAKFAWVRKLIYKDTVFCPFMRALWLSIYAGYIQSHAKPFRLPRAPISAKIVDTFNDAQAKLKLTKHEQRLKE